MKKLLMLVTAVVIVVATCLVAGCEGEANTYINKEETINTRVGKDFVIALDSNPTTGYDWEATYDESMLTLVYEAYSIEKCPGLVGAGGTRYLGFEALRAGEAEITVDYQRSWEEESIDQRVFTVKIK